MNVAFDRFCTGYAFVAVAVHPCPLASGHVQKTNDDNKKKAPKDRFVMLILFTPLKEVASGHALPPFQNVARFAATIIHALPFEGIG
jgi:hypothetical protein